MNQSLYPALSDHQRMKIQIETLYVCDHAKRLLSINEPGNPRAPHFFMGRTGTSTQWRFRHDLPPETVAQLEELCQSEPVVTRLGQPPENYAAIKAVLERDAPIASEYRGPAYWIPADVQMAGEAVLITEANAELAYPHFPWLVEPTFYPTVGPVAAVVVDKSAVSICFCSRSPGQATEAGVETHPNFRRRGYAAKAVAGWAAAVHQLGYQPLYSTSWANLASQGIARKLGMVMYGEDWSLV